MSFDEKKLGLILAYKYSVYWITKYRKLVVLDKTLVIQKQIVQYLMFYVSILQILHFTKNRWKNKDKSYDHLCRSPGERQL